MIYQLETGASSDGHHAISSFLQCARKSNLDAADKERWREQMQPLQLGNDGFSIGALYHAFMDLYYSKRVSGPKDLDEVEFATADNREVVIDGEALFEAKRVATAWMADYSAELFGTILGTEYQIPNSINVQQAWKRTAASGRIDLLCKINKKDAEKLSLAFLKDVPPGIYSLDWKTEQAERGSLADEHLNSLQQIGYMVAMQAAGIKITGVLIVCAIKTKIPKFRLFCRGLPTVNEVKALQTRHAIEAIVRAHPVLQNAADTTNCFPFLQRPCRHWVSGACPRH